MAAQKLEDKLLLMQTTKTQEEAFGKFVELIAGYGYDDSIYTLMTDHPTVSRPACDGLVEAVAQDWRDYFRANNHRRIDTVWEGLPTSPTPCFWAELIDRLKQSGNLPEDRLIAPLRVLNEAGDAGMADGIGVSYASPAIEIAGLGLSRERAEKKRSYEELAEIFVLATFFHEKFLSFYERPEVPRLTPREREVLVWAAEGKADCDIGCILGVSASTVRFHWKNIFEKLGVKGRLRAVIKAMQLGIITPQPVSADHGSRATIENP